MSYHCNRIGSVANHALISYFPGLALVLGWPLVASKMMDGRM